MLDRALAEQASPWYNDMILFNGLNYHLFYDYVF